MAARADSGETPPARRMTGANVSDIFNRYKYVYNWKPRLGHHHPLDGAHGSILRARGFQ